MKGKIGEDELVCEVSKPRSPLNLASVEKSDNLDARRQERAFLPFFTENWVKGFKINSNGQVSYFFLSF